MQEDEIRAALRQSEQRLASEIQELQMDRGAKNAEMLRREFERLDRVIAYRREKELQTIRTQEERIARLGAGGTTEERRIIPALQGRIEKARERLERIKLNERDERALIEERARLALSFEPIAAAFVHQRPS